MRDKLPGRRRFFRLSTAATTFCLAGCQTEETPTTETGGDRSDLKEPIKAYLRAQSALGDALDSLVDANHELSGKKNEIRAMLLGIVATGDTERFIEATLPDGWNRESVFEATREDRRKVSEAGYDEHAPSSVRELKDVIEQYEARRAASERFLTAVAEAAKDVRDQWTQNAELFDPAGDGATKVRHHPQFAEQTLPLADSPWIIIDKMPVLQREYPALFDRMEKLADGLLADCDFECTEATAKVATGPGKGINLNRHAWIKWTRRFDRTCPALEPQSKTFSHQWGFYLVSLFESELRYDGNRAWTCNTDEWVGPCDDSDLAAMEKEVIRQRNEGPDQLWFIQYNCGDWALDKLAMVDSDLASQYGPEPRSAYILIPSELCDPE